MSTKTSTKSGREQCNSHQGRRFEFDCLWRRCYSSGASATATGKSEGARFGTMVSMLIIPALAAVLAAVQLCCCAAVIRGRTLLDVHKYWVISS